MLEVNLKNRAITQHTRTFNSMCKFGDHYLGASSSGLFRIGGYNDAGVQIPALSKSGMTDFGMASLKRFRFFYFGLETTGSLILKVFCDGTLAAAHTVTPATKGQRTVRVPVSRQHAGRYWSWSTENVNGSFFALYSVQAIPVILHPNIGQ